MKQKIFLIVATFVAWTLLFMLQKPVFLLIYAGGLADTWAVMTHGLPIDLSMAGYLTVVPALLLLLSDLPVAAFRRPKALMVWRWALAGYFGLSSLLAALSFVANVGLYGYWRFPLDSTVWFFLTSSPADALASVSWSEGLIGLLALAVVTAAISLVFHLLYGRAFLPCAHRKRWPIVVELLMLAALILPIRGGVTVSSMNTGKAYFSQQPVINHAAVNPLFSFMESMTHQEDFASQYRFMDDARAQRLVDDLNKPTGNTTTTRVLPGDRQDRPDVYLIVLESFSDTVMKARTPDITGRMAEVTPSLNALKSKGIYFSRFYANSFRTDRGLVSILQGYPAPATVSLMKYPKKTAAIPSLAARMAESGRYKLKYYYGGDADFTNMRSFLINQGFEDITSDVDFPVADRLSKWGVPDHLLFARVKGDLEAHYKKAPSDVPYLRVIQTSSSHEPFDVPYHRLRDKTLNAFAYADSCVGDFVAWLRKSPQWKRSLVIIVPDHLGAWPKDTDNFKPWRFHIPMIWTGGYVGEPCVVDTLASQQDLAATLLHQLGMDASDMKFSKDIFDNSIPHYAFFLMNDGIGMIDRDNTLIYDNKLGRTVVDEGPHKGKNLRRGQALLQVLFDDIASLSTKKR